MEQEKYLEMSPSANFKTADDVDDDFVYPMLPQLSFLVKIPYTIINITEVLQ
jgi:hypothetical protein